MARAKSWVLVPSAQVAATAAFQEEPQVSQGGGPVHAPGSRRRGPWLRTVCFLHEGLHVQCE